jgi:hypothetical protein
MAGASSPRPRSVTEFVSEFVSEAYHAPGAGGRMRDAFAGHTSYVGGTRKRVIALLPKERCVVSVLILPHTLAPVFFCGQ